MKYNPIDRMQDPYFALILSQIEDLICQADTEATTSGIQLTDAQIKSVLIKTQKKLKGGNPDIPATNQRDQILAKLVENLIHPPKKLMELVATEDGTTEEIPLTLSDWGKGLETVEYSVKHRKSDLPGSRDYLDFVQQFLARAKADRG